MIYLLRHGEIANGSRKRFFGQTDCDLSTKGRLQAESWHGFFASIDPGLILCSDLKRSLDTARIIAGRQTDLVRIDSGLREIHLGDWEGREFSEIRTLYPEDWKKRGLDPAGYSPPGGESFADLAFRVIPVFERAAVQDEKDVLIVGHAGVNRVLLCHVLGLPLQNLFRLGQDYAGLSILERKEEFFRVKGLNIQLKRLSQIV